MTAHPTCISADALKRRLKGSEGYRDNREFALLDVREEGAYGTGHILQSVNVPYSRLELLVRSYVPRRNCAVILVGQTDDACRLAARRLQAIGYSDTGFLQGGTEAWQAAGQTLFHGVYVPSKAYGEWLEHAYRTPAISAPALQELFAENAGGANVVVLDPRTVAEYAVRHVPGAISCPGGELLYRFRDLVPRPDTLVVVACGGRTRGIVGAQNLIDAGVPNPVVALADGTHGWQLAGFELEHGLVRQYEAATPAAAAYAQECAAALVRRTGLPAIDFPTFQRWRADPLRTTYAFDVRTPEEYAQGHLSSVRSAPGGQLVQATDRWMATLGARVVLIDDNGVRAATTAYRLRQMGWDAYVLQGVPASEMRVRSTGRDTIADTAPAAVVVGIAVATAAAADAAADVQPEHEPVAAAASEITPVEASQRLAAGALGVSLDASAQFLQRRPPGTVWANRARLDTVIEQLCNGRELILFSETGDAAHLAAIDLQEAVREKGIEASLSVVRGGLQAWRRAGLALDDGAVPPLAEKDRIDTLYWAHTRRQGDKIAMRIYLDWEKALLAQVMQDGYRFSEHVQPPTVQP